MKTLSLVVPVYYEEDCIGQFLKETIPVLEGLSMDYEIVFVDDGSQDRTPQLIKQAASDNPKIKLLEFSYNHGKQAAVTAGITYATGDYLLYMDPDLQDPPNEIPKFVDHIEKGFDLVFGVRKEKHDSFINTAFSKLFWLLLARMTGLKIPKGLAVMRIFNRKFAQQFLKYGEQNRFIEGIFMHIAMKWTTIEIEQRPRFAGVSKFNFRRKFNLAFDAIFDFSALPLRLAARVGLLFVIAGGLTLLAVVLLKIFLIDFQAGWPSLFSAILVGTGLNLYFIGIVAIYVGRIYREVKGRPLFSIKEKTNLES